MKRLLTVICSCKEAAVLVDYMQVEKCVYNTICSSIICESACDENKLPIYRPTHLITILAAAVLANHSPRIHI